MLKHLDPGPPETETKRILFESFLIGVATRFELQANLQTHLDVCLQILEELGDYSERLVLDKSMWLDR